MKLNKPIPSFIEPIEDIELIQMIDEFNLIKTDEDICDCCRNEITQSLIKEYVEGRKLQ